MCAWKIRMSLAVAVALPLIMVLLVGNVRGQRLPGQPPRPPSFKPPKPPAFNPPQKVWTCGKCGANLGSGDFPPAQCPTCGARIVNGIGGGNPSTPQPPANNQPPKFTTVWKCLKCDANLGSGASPPAQCPSCGVRILNGVGGVNPPANNIPINQNPAFNQAPQKVVVASASSAKVFYSLGAIAGLGLMIGGIVTALKCGGYF